MISPIMFVFSLILSSCIASHVQDFCVADYRAPQGPAGYSCKNPAKVTVDDFIYSGLRFPGNTSNIHKFGYAAASVAQFPGTNGLGISAGRADLGVRGAVPIHSHRGATELVYIAEGRSVLAGFIASNNKVYTKILRKGDVMVLPQGLYHFFLNRGRTPAIIFVSFSSENPGVEVLETSLFQSNLDSRIIAKTTLLDYAQIRKLKRLFGGSN